MAVTYGAGSKVILMDTAADALPGLMKVRDINWIKPNAAGDDLVVSTTGGAKICSMTASAQYADQKREIRQWVDGIVLTTRDSGTLEVVLE